ncbi:MAG: peptidase U32 family protein [Planctomycetota bacterium]|jgi:putative protease
MTKPIELLAPAKDYDAARAAILCGADAVYMGAAQFSARQAAGNDLETIGSVIDLAHPYYVKVYVALNTLLFDNELDDALKLINQLYNLGIDGLIIQDTGLLEMDLPAIPIIASTQMNNATPEKVRFLEDVGFSRVILARELTLEQIKDIRSQTTVELECFVHGALCVGLSGQCTMSYALGKRSGNRGQCAQPCRKKYTLKDADGNTIAENQYLLSLKDLCLSDYLEDMLDAGVTSFKIEGRLKEAPYVANVVGYYRQQLDTILEKQNMQKSSSGTTELYFKPDPAKTFSRRFTDYGITGRLKDAGAIDTPKSVGQYIGAIVEVGRDWFTLDTDINIHNADGLCFFDDQNELTGTVVNRLEGKRIYPQRMDHLTVGLEIYRNYDHAFIKQFQGRFAERRINVEMILQSTDTGVALVGVDEDGSTATFEMDFDKEPAKKIEQAEATIQTQLAKLGNTLFQCSKITIDTPEIYFFPVSVLNTLKRGLVEALMQTRLQNRPKLTGCITKNNFPYPEKHLTFRANVLNEKAKAFYQRHQVETIEPAAESGLDMAGRLVMTSKYCLRRQLNQCLSGKAPDSDWYLEDAQRNRFKIEFDCPACQMNLYWQ